MTDVSRNEGTRLLFSLTVAASGETKGGSPEDDSGSWPSALQRSAAQAQSARGRSPDLQVIAKPATFPSLSRGTVVLQTAGSLAAHSGATVRDFHPLPFSLAAGRAPRNRSRNNTSVRARSIVKRRIERKSRCIKLVGSGSGCLLSCVPIGVQSKESWRRICRG